MAGLVTYGSSDDEENENESASQVMEEIDISTLPKQPATNGATTTASRAVINSDQCSRPSSIHENHEEQPDVVESTAPLEGPVIGPTIPANVPTTDLLEEDSEMPPQSPYSANRALLRDLTLPTVPNYDIPMSPSGSPIESTNVKFKHFLNLKAQGIHFNQKLAKSAAMKNPSLMQKLMEFAGVDESEQYSTTLSKNLWDPEGFPARAYKEELARSQQAILKRKEEERLRSQRESVDFVPATSTGEAPSRSGMHATKSGQKSAAERIMAGLERSRSSSPQVQGTKRKTRFDS